MNFGALGSNIYPGFLAGQSNLQKLQDDALIIQQHQMDLDQRKRDLAARAARFTNINGGGQQGGQPQMLNGPAGPMPQPPMPGQPSQPAGPQPPPGPVPGAPPQAAPQPGGPGPGAAPAGSPAPGAAPGPAAPGAQPQPGQQSGQPGGQLDLQNIDYSQTDPQKVIMSVAQDIKKRNPNIDPLTLADAVEQQIGAMQKITPDARAVLNAEVQIARIQAGASQAEQRAANAVELAQIRADAAENVARIRADIIEATQKAIDARFQQSDATRQRGQNITSADRAAQRDTTERGQNLRASAAADAEAGRNERAKFIQGQINARIDARAGQNSGKVADAAKYKKLMADRQQVTDQMQAYQQSFGASGITPQQYQQLVQQKKKLDGDIASYWGARQWLPKPSELVNIPYKPGAGGGAGQPQQFTPGQTFKGKDGKTYKVLPGGDPADPDVEEVTP